MRKKWILIMMSFTVIISLTACSEIDELLGKINQILDDQIEETGTDKDINQTGNNEENEDNNNDNDDNDTNGDSNNNSNDNSNDDSNNNSNQANNDNYNDNDINDLRLTVEERINFGYYDSFDLPNGFDVPIPFDWYLIQVIKDPLEGDNAWHGVFCFDTLLEETYTSFENELPDYNFSVESESVQTDEQPGNKYVTKFDFNGEEHIKGDLIYLLNKYYNNCAELYVEF